MISTVDLDGTRLRYSRTASGPHDGRVPVLLLHPWFGCRAFWDSTCELLGAPSYSVDWYSIGEGDWGTWGSPEGLARAVLVMLDALEHDRVDVVGNSVGGIVAQILAARHSARVRRLVLVGTGAWLGGHRTPFGELVEAWLVGAGERTALAAALVDALVATPLPEAARSTYVEAVLAADPDFLSAVLVQARGLDLRPELGRITAPTLVIRGEHDAARTPEHVVELLDGLPDAYAVEMTGCGHAPMVEQPEAFAVLVRRHLHR